MKPDNYEAVSESRTREELRRALTDFAAHMGFPLINALHVNGSLDSPDLRIGSIGNTPSEYLLTHSDLSRIRIDPVMRRLMDQPTPFYWDQAFYANRSKGELWEEQAPHGYRVGVAASLPVGPGLHVFVGVDRHEKLPTNGELLTRMYADLQLLAVHAHVAARKLLVKSLAPDIRTLQLPRLSPREQEVLRWTNEGKTLWEIGVILGIRQSSVNNYIRSAMDKLGVSGSKHMAVKLAATLGLI